MSLIAHVTPIDGGPPLLSGAGDVIQRFALTSGERLWTAHSQGQGVVPSLVTGHGLVFAPLGIRKDHAARRVPRQRALRHFGYTHRRGADKGVPRIPSFVYVKPHLFTITEGGIAMCVEGNAGEIVWQERIGG